MDCNTIECPEWVIFDLDNTLYPYQSAHQPAMAALKQFLSDYLRQVDFETAYSQAREKVKERLGNCASAHSRLLYIKTMFDSCEGITDPAVILDGENIYWSTYLENAKLFEGVIDFLEILQIKKIKKYLVTDLTTQIQLKKIKKLGLEKYFDLVITSEEAGGDKVTKLPFQMLIEQEELDLNSRGWSIGDAQCDINIPKSIFSNCLTFQKNHHPKFENADILFNDFKELMCLS